MALQDSARPLPSRLDRYSSRVSAQKIDQGDDQTLNDPILG